MISDQTGLHSVLLPLLIVLVINKLDSCLALQSSDFTHMIVNPIELHLFLLPLFSETKQVPDSFVKNGEVLLFFKENVIHHCDIFGRDKCSIIFEPFFFLTGYRYFTQQFTLFESLKDQLLMTLAFSNRTFC